MLISIITINYNDAVGLERTIKSVREQTAENFEHIIIDGCSADGSKEVIEKYEDGFSYWVSEKDSGIYHAMNKGIALAKGDYFLFLNSGDCFYDLEVLGKAVRFIKQHSYIDLVYGNLEIVDKEIVTIHKFPSILPPDFFIELNLGHPSTFMKRELFQRFGYYNEQSAIIADYEFMATVVVKHNCSTMHINTVISRFYMDGISSDPANKQRLIDDRLFFLKNQLPQFYQDYKLLKAAKKIIKNTNSDIFEFSTRPLGLKLLKIYAIIVSFIYKMKG